MGFLLWESRVAFPVGKPAVHTVCFCVSIIHRTLAWTTGSLTCAQMLMHAIALGSVQTHVRESALKVESGRKKPLPHRGIEPASAAWRSNALPMSYIPLERFTWKFEGKGSRQSIQHLKRGKIMMVFHEGFRKTTISFFWEPGLLR